MSLPVIVFLTSKVCSVCEKIRSPSKGKICPLAKTGEDTNAYAKRLGFPLAMTFPGDGRFEVDFFRKIITGGSGKGPAQYRVYCIQLETMAATWTENNVTEISIAELDGDGVKQTIFSSKGGKTHQESIKITDKVTKILDRQETVDWTTTIDVYVPKGLVGYCWFFPAFLVFSGTLWDNSLKNKLPLYGIINGAQTKKVSPWGVDIPSGQPSIVSIFEFLKKINEKILSLEAPPPPPAPLAVPLPIKTIETIPLIKSGGHVCGVGTIKLTPATRR
jgi:hypothetical protein